MGGRVLDAGREGGQVSGAGPGRGAWRPFYHSSLQKSERHREMETVQKKTSFRVKMVRSPCIWSNIL